jgi:CheY-like chemotaxis protein
MNRNSYETSLTTRSILLAEDDVDDQDFITEAFRNIDPQLTIHIVPNGNSVLPFLQNLTDTQLPQLMVLDYNLPQLDGCDVLQTLTAHERYRAIPKIVWSTSNAPQYKARSLEQGAACYMVKPSDMAGVETMARQMLDSCKAAV